MAITYQGKQYRDDGAPLDASGNVSMGGSWINPNYAHDGGILTDSSGTRFDAGSIGANGGLQIRPDAQFGAPKPAQTQSAPAYQYNDPRMRSDYASYFQNSTPGQEQAWGGGSLTRMANGSANYQYGGQNHLIDANTDIGSLAAFSPELASELQRNYPGQTAPQAQQGAMANAAGSAGAVGGMAGTGGQGIGGMIGHNMPQQMGPAGGQGGMGIGGMGQGGNPYLMNMADEMGRRTQQGLGQSFNQIRSNAVGTGGLGGSRQGVAEGVAAGQAMDSLQGNLAGLFSGQYNQDATRGLQQYGMDQNYSLGAGGLANQRYGMDQNYALGAGGLANQRYGMDQNYDLGSQNARNSFYTAQRGQDLASTSLGADLYSRGMNGMWDPLNNASKVYSPVLNSTGNTSTSQDNGSGWERAAGGLMAGATFGRQMGWY